MSTPTFTNSLSALIMAGGSGTRFWPASRNEMPKQLLRLAGERTLLQATLDRIAPLLPTERVLVMTSQRLVPTIRGQLPQLPATSILGEPCKRDTAPCIGLAALLFARIDPQAIMVVMPSDHVIDSPAQFQAAIQQAVAIVQQDPRQLVTFGIRPTYPAESFGYVERAAPWTADPFPAFRVARFHEKPSGDRARDYLAAGRYYWNSGIFVWRAATLIELLQRHEPQMVHHLRAIADAADTPRFATVFAEEFAQIVGRSIDYAVMEKAPDVVVIEAPFHWDDVGSWQAIARLHPADDQGNTFFGRQLAFDTRRTLIRTTEEHLVVAIGLEDVMIIHTDDATLVVHKNQEENVRKAVQELEKRGWLDVL